jgi:hypothetical protein
MKKKSENHGTVLSIPGIAGSYLGTAVSAGEKTPWKLPFFFKIRAPVTPGPTRFRHLKQRLS